MIADADGLLRFEDFRSGSIAHAFAPAAAFGGYDASRGDQRGRLARRVLGESALLHPTHQTHSARVAVVSREHRAREAGVDGLITRDEGLLLHAVSADCPLLYLAARDGARGGAAVAIVHCGWRGAAGGIVRNAIEGLRDAAGAAPDDLIAAVSPGVGGCCYEVGDEVLEKLAAAGVDVARFSRPSPAGRRLLDLKGGVAQLVERCGVAREAIHVAPECTICGGERFHSYRRSAGAAGRMSGVIGLRENRSG